MARLLKPIPDTLKRQMQDDPFYKICCLKNQECFGRIEWHHHLRYAGQRQNEKFGILPLCSYHHSVEKQKDTTKKLNKIMFSRTTEEERKKYPRLLWHQYNAQRIRHYEENPELSDISETFCV